MKTGNNRSNQRFQQNQMNFAGYGPAGWRRSDELIEDDICKRLYTDQYLDATGVQVEVSGGNVTLSGHVPTERNRQSVTSITMGVPGVKHLNNHLEIAITASASQQQPATATGTSAGRSTRA